MSISNNIYNILGKLKSITNTESSEADTTSTEVVYESVEARGDIMEAVRSLESKFETFKEAKKAKPDFLDVDKDGDKKEPFKKAVKDKKAKQVDEAADKSLDEPLTPEEEQIYAAILKRVRDDAEHYNIKTNEGQGPYELYNPKHPKFKANYDKFKKKNPDAKLEDFVAAMKKKEATMNEAAYDEPEAPNADAIAKRKRLQALKDKQEDERAELGQDKPESNVRIHKGTYGNEYKGDADLDEVAPPGAKAERMVKHIKKGYAKDGKLTKREKGIAYATAWKAKKAGVVEGTEFKDTIANSKAEMKKAKLAKVTESRVMEETDYFYEKVGKALAEKNPNLDTAAGEFVDAMRKEMVAQGIPPNRARNIIMMDDDFISDVATSYGHYCKDVAEATGCSMSEAPMEQELDEIAALAGLARASAPAIAGAVSNLSDSDDMEEDTMGAVMGGIAGGMVGKTPGAVATGAKLGSAARDAFNSATGLDEITAPPKAVPGKAPSAKATGMAPAKPGVPPTPTFNEEEIDEGNEFTKARLDAIAAGKDTFTVGGKTYKIAGDTSQEKVQVAEDATITVSATLEDDALNLMRKLAGMAEKEPELRDVSTDDFEGAELDEERDIEWDNTPEEDVAPLGASIPSGNDLHKSKRQDPATANKAANPLKDDNKVAESLWKAYEDMINDVKK